MNFVDNNIHAIFMPKELDILKERQIIIYDSHKLTFEARTKLDENDDIMLILTIHDDEINMLVGRVNDETAFGKFNIYGEERKETFDINDFDFFMKDFPLQFDVDYDDVYCDDNIFEYPTITKVTENDICLVLQWMSNILKKINNI